MRDEQSDAGRPRWSVGAAVGTYLVTGLLWIVASTPLVDGLSNLLDVPATSIELFKGLGFVVVTATVLYASMRHWETAYGDASRQRERALEVREHRFRALAEETQGAVYRFRFTPAPVIEYLSPQFEQMTGYSSDVMRSEPSLLLKRVHPDDRDRLLSLHGADPSRRPATPRVTAFRFQRLDGTWIWIEDHHTPEVGPDGEVAASQGIAFDVTARQREEEARLAALVHEQEASERLRDMVQAHRSFLTGISHELRTPLTSVIGLAQTLEAHRDDLPGRDQRELLGRLLSNATRLGQLLDDLLDLDRLGRGVLQVDLADGVDLAELCAVVADGLAAPDHRVHVDVPRTSLRLDRPKVERIVDNLLRNAVRHTPAGTEVWVRVEQHVDAIVLVVEDDGPGIDGDANTLFKPFRQGPAAVSQPNPGTGIGLALVREFALLHSGDAWFEPREPSGARFCVRLPTHVLPNHRLPTRAAVPRQVERP